MMHETFLIQINLLSPQAIKSVTLHFKKGCCYTRNDYIELRIGNVDAADDSRANPRVAATGFARVKRTIDYQVKDGI